MKEFEAVVFDMDGVIFDSETATLGCWIELSERYGIPEMKKTFLACTGTTKEKTKEIMLGTYGEDFPYDRYAKEASVMFHARYDGGRIPVKNGVAELLGFLKSNGKKIALASSTRYQTVTAELRDAKLLDFFDEVVTGDMVTKSKPDPEIFLLACEKLGVSPGSAYAIEDSYNGIRSAARGGLRPIMVPDLSPANDEMRELSEVILENLLCVKDYLQ